MKISGQKASLNPSAMLTSLLGRRAKLHEELRIIEKQVNFPIFLQLVQEFNLAIINNGFFFFWDEYPCIEIMGI